MCRHRKALAEVVNDTLTPIWQEVHWQSLACSCITPMPEPHPESRWELFRSLFQALAMFRCPILFAIAEIGSVSIGSLDRNNDVADGQ